MESDRNAQHPGDRFPFGETLQGFQQSKRNFDFQTPITSVRALSSYCKDLYSSNFRPTVFLRNRGSEIRILEEELYRTKTGIQSRLADNSAMSLSHAFRLSFGRSAAPPEGNSFKASHHLRAGGPWQALDLNLANDCPVAYARRWASNQSSPCQSYAGLLQLALSEGRSLMSQK